MSELIGYSVVKNDGTVVVSGLRFNEARRKTELLNQSGFVCKIREDWQGSPVTMIDKFNDKANANERRRNKKTVDRA